MAEIKYINSANRSIDLSTYPIRLKQKTSGLYAFEWEVDETDLGNGARVNAFERKSKQYELEIDFSGARAARAQILQEFFEVTDYDVVQKSTGKLYVNDQYVEAYIIASEPQIYDDRYRTVGKICTLYVPYPFWMEDKTFSFYPKEEGGSGDFLDFPFDFPFDFTSGKAGTATLQNTHYVASGFEMIIYGPCVNPYIAIGGHMYRVYTTVDDQEYIRINSRENTVQRVKNNGEIVNEYNNRGKDDSVFEPIPPGSQTVVWPGTFGFDVILHQERSELKWN